MNEDDNSLTLNPSPSLSVNPRVPKKKSVSKLSATTVPSSLWRPSIDHPSALSSSSSSSSSSLPKPSTKQALEEIMKRLIGEDINDFIEPPSQPSPMYWMHQFLKVCLYYSEVIDLISSSSDVDDENDEASSNDDKKKKKKKKKSSSKVHSISPLLTI
ncbi:MAG TPA: hypothetical protein VHN59_07235 [Chitinophagaceae bacterium]|nr:hypothetical protein [Chitinophagaceae bacterium]